MAISQEILDSTREAFARDRPLNDDLEPGSFFDDPAYFDSLPFDAKCLICAVQCAGDDPNRPGFCHIQSEKVFDSYLVTRKEDELVTAVALEAMSLRYVPPHHPGRGKSNHHMGRLFQQRWELTNQAEDLDQTIKHYRLAVEHAAKEDALYAWVCDLAVLVNRRYVRQHRPADLEEAGSCYDRALALVGKAPNRAVLLSNKGDFLRMTSGEGGLQLASRIAEAVSCQAAAVDLCAEYLALPFKPHLPYGNIHGNAAQAYMAQFDITRNETDIGMAISMLEKAISLVAGQHAPTQKFNVELGRAYFVRGEKLHRFEDIGRAAKILGKVILEDPNNVNAQLQIGELAHYQAANLTHQSLANKTWELALGLMEGAVSVMPADFDTRASVYYRCSAVYYSKYDINGQRSDLDRAIEYSRLATTCQGTEGLWNYYGFLGQCLLERHKHSKDPQDLADASASVDDAVRRCGPGNLLAQAECKWITGKIRKRLYDDRRELQTLRDARDTFLEVVDVFPATSSSKPLALNDLGNVYIDLFSHEALPEHLEKATDAYKRSLAYLQQLHPHEPHPNVLMLNGSLGLAMLQRYLFWRAEADLDSGISYYRRSIDKIDESHWGFAPRASNLSYALQLLFELNDDVGLLREAQHLVNRALNGPFQLSAEQINTLETYLGDIFYRLFIKSNQPSDLDNAVVHYDRALAAPGVSLAHRATTLTNKAALLAGRAEMTGSPSDFEASYAVSEEVRQLLPKEDPDAWIGSFNQARLALAMFNRHIRPDRNVQGLRVLDKFAALAEATSVRPGIRINSASIAASLAFEIQHNPAKARDFICISLRLLPEAILLHESRLEQMKFIRTYHYVPSSAAALSLAANDAVSVAIHRLEAGRANIWDRLLGQRTPVDALKIVDEELADRLQSLQKRLSQRVPASGKSSGLADLTSMAPRDEMRLQRHRDAASYRQLIQEIRQIDGFGDFLELPERPEGLQNYAATAPIVFINASGYRSDALIITKDKVFSLPLPLFSMDAVRENGAKFLQSHDELSSGNPDMVVAAYTGHKTTMKWLWESAAKPILDNIDFSGYPRGLAGKPRVIWVSTGWMSILPIHAAGDFSDDGVEAKPSCVHDVVVSSYTTSLKALSSVRQSMVRLQLAKAEPKPRNGLIVAMASTPGMGRDHDLNVELDVHSFEEQLKPCMNIEKLHQPESQVVKDRLRSSCIAHFACHAQANSKDPSKSAIMLQDCYRNGHFRDPQPFCVRTLINLDVSECELVYLSACETGASRDLLLRDEGIHLAGGFHMAGVPHVISTLWRVVDVTAGQLAGLFYANLKNEQQELDVDRSADALHMAVQELRNRGVEPLLWGPFIHSGP